MPDELPASKVIQYGQFYMDFVRGETGIIRVLCPDGECHMFPITDETEKQLVKAIRAKPKP